MFADAAISPQRLFQRIGETLGHGVAAHAIDGYTHGGPHFRGPAGAELGGREGHAAAGNFTAQAVTGVDADGDFLRPAVADRRAMIAPGVHGGAVLAEIILLPLGNLVAESIAAHAAPGPNRQVLALLAAEGCRSNLFGADRVVGRRFDLGRAGVDFGHRPLLFVLGLGGADLFVQAVDFLVQALEFGPAFRGPRLVAGVEFLLDMAPQGHSDGGSFFTEFFEQHG